MLRKQDEYDIRAAEESHLDYVLHGKKSRPIADLWKEVHLYNQTIKIYLVKV